MKKSRPSSASLRTAALVPVLLLPTFLGFVDLWIMIVALPYVQSDLGASQGAAQLFVGLYLTTYGAFLVLGGRLGDRFGRRRLLVTGLLVFTVSSAVCMAAPDPAALILARGVQGAGAALMLPQVLSVIQVSVPPEQRSGAIGAYSTVIGLAIVSGLILGGVLLQADLFGFGWRTLFAIKIPIGAAVLPLVLWAVPESRSSHREPLDLVGAALLGMSLVAVLLSLVLGADDGWSGAKVAGVVVGLAFGAAFARRERRLERESRDPLVAPRVVRERAVRFGLLSTLFFYIATSGIFVVLPYLFEQALQLSPLGTGLAFAPLGIAFAASSLLSRTPWAPTGSPAVMTGTVVMLVGLGSAAVTAWQDGSTVTVSAPLAAFGFGAGMVFPQIVTTVLARVPARDAGAASGVLLTATQIANSLGVVVVGGAFTAAESLGTRNAFAVAALVAFTGTCAIAITEWTRIHSTTSTPRSGIGVQHRGG